MSAYAVYLVGQAFAALAQRLHRMQFLSLLTRFISVFQECGLHVLHRWTPLHKRYECRTFSPGRLGSSLIFSSPFDRHV